MELLAPKQVDDFWRLFGRQLIGKLYQLNVCRVEDQVTEDNVVVLGGDGSDLSINLKFETDLLSQPDAGVLFQHVVDRLD